MMRIGPEYIDTYKVKKKRERVFLDNLTGKCIYKS